MKERPEGLGESEVRRALRGWGIDAVSLDHAPVGFGDHHWTATGDRDRRWFVTVADLTHKDWLGEEAETAFHGLARAMDTAAALHDRCGLDFVVAPLPASSGETVRRLGARYALSVFPFVEGVPGRFGQELTAQERGMVVDMLAELHRAAPPAPALALRPELPGRAFLEQSLGELGRPWQGGPFSEHARAAVSAQAPGLRRRLAEFDQRIDELFAKSPELVVTHGEPHPGNLVRVGAGHLLVDWDTVGLAVPERDLWLVAREPDDLARYADASGRKPDPSALELYRLRWAFDDVATYVRWFRSPHERTPDTEQAWEGFSHTLERLAAGDGPA